ncbi:ester cyclase [Pseudonocardia sp.]|uniref:ester cyclase n=1 Tax=Pseudonocardia sp. TaxID=60912 RepID=UPI003D0D4C14
MTDGTGAHRLETLARASVARFERGERGAVDALLAPDVCVEVVSTGRRIEGAAAVLEALAAWRAAFPDAEGEVVRVLTNGDTAALEIVWHGTHTGPLVTPAGTVAPTGRTVECWATLWQRWDGARLVHERTHADVPSLLARIRERPPTAGGSRSAASRSHSHEEDDVSTEDNKKLVARQFDEIWNGARWDTVEELYAPDYVNHDPYNPDQPTGPAGFRARVEGYRSVLDEFDLRIEQQIAEGDMVETHWSLRGVHRGPLEGVEPTGRRVEVDGQLLSRIVGGRFVEEWVHWDTLGLLRQIGAVPVPAG